MSEYINSIHNRLTNRAKQIFKFFSEGTISGKKFKEYVFQDTDYQCTINYIDVVHPRDEDEWKPHPRVHIKKIYIEPKNEADYNFLAHILETHSLYENFYLWLLNDRGGEILSKVRDFKIQRKFPSIANEPVILKKP